MEQRRLGEGAITNYNYFNLNNNKYKTEAKKKNVLIYTNNNKKKN